MLRIIKAIRLAMNAGGLNVKNAIVAPKKDNIIKRSIKKLMQK